MLKEKTIAFGDDRLFYRMAAPTFNNGSILHDKAIVLLHGFAEDGQVWKQASESLQKDYLVIMPDFPGSGQSPVNPATISHWSMEYFADGIRAILAEEKIYSACLIGHSMGGYVALAYAEKYPERTHGLGLFHSTAYADSEERKTIRRRGIEFIKENGAGKFLQQAVPNLFSAPFKEQFPDKVQHYLHQYADFSGEALIQYYEAMINRPDRTMVFRETTAPVLFVIGAADQTIPPEQVLPQTYLPNISWVEVLRESAHMGMLEEPEKTYRVLAQFCA